MTTPVVTRLAAFTQDPSGGNPAGVVVGDRLPPPREMQRIAAEVGYSETAFLARGDDRAFTVRYYAPESEVAFCGHATIAAGVLLGETQGPGGYRFDTLAGEVPVDVEVADGAIRAVLTSVPPRERAVPTEELRRVLSMFGWGGEDLNPGLPPVEAFAGAWHLVLGLRERSTLSRMDYRFDALREWMTRRGLTTVQVVWREDALTFHARNPFPVGGVVEDPATGAAAAALGGYLRAHGLVRTPANLSVHQGEDLGRPSILHVEIPDGGGIRVAGTAVRLDGPASEGSGAPVGAQ